MPGITLGMTAEGLALPRNEKRCREGAVLKSGVQAARYGVSERPLAASRGLFGESPCPGASTTTTVPTLTCL